MADVRGALIGYINATVDNLMRGEHRAMQRRPTDSLDEMLEGGGDLVDPHTDPAREAIERLSSNRVSIQRAVREAMEQLSQRQQRIIEWTFLHEPPLKPRQIAKLLGISSVAVRVELFRARKRLKKILEKLLKSDPVILSAAKNLLPHRDSSLRSE